MGVTTDTPVNIVIGAGEVYIDGSIVGATTGDNIFRVTRTYYQPQLNGVPGPLEETDYITSETAELECAMPEMSAAILALLLPNSTDTQSGADHRVTSDGVRRVTSDNYHTVAIRVPGLDNISYEFEVRRAIITTNVEFSAQDAGLLAPRVTWQGRWEAGGSGPSNSPWSINRLQAGS